MNKNEQLINQLADDLAPVPSPVNVNRLAMTWFMGSAVFVIAITHLAGPVRPGVLAQLASEPRFLFETLLGVTAIIWVSLQAFRSAVPAALTRLFAVAGLALIALWLAQYVIGFKSPALDPSTLGKRPHCFKETLIYSIPPILAGLIVIRRLYPLAYVRSAMTISLAAGMMPALYMQIACMYEPAHILGFHVFPGLLMVLAGAVIATLWRPRN